MSVYVDHAFAGDWGRWSGGGHMQAATLEELHEFAADVGLKPGWFQARQDRPEASHYDLTQSKRLLALRLGAIAEPIEAGTARRKAARDSRS